MAQTLACYAACTTLQIGADTEAHGAFPSVTQLSCMGCPYVAEGCERAVGCPSANNAGKVSWLSNGIQQKAELRDDLFRKASWESLLPKSTK